MAFTQGHALVVGVGTYAKLPRWNVPKTAADARAVAEVLKNPQFCGYPEGQITLLTDDKATRQGMIDALDKLAQTVGEQDTLFFFFSGHGDHDAQKRYYLTTHDTTLEDGKIAPDSALSQGELLPRLRAIKAKRLILVLNACFSGDMVETLGEGEALGEGETLGSMLTEDEANALLGSGEGRVIITACRERQRSYVGKGSELTIFAEELVNRLKGRGVTPQKGFISAYDLYTALYNNVLESVQDKERVTPTVYQKYGAQEPELTIIKGVGPFAVALYRGSETLGDQGDDTLEGAAPMMETVRRASRADAFAAYNYQIQIATTTTHNTASGQGSMAGNTIGGSVTQGFGSGTTIGGIEGGVQGGIGNTTTNTATGPGGVAGNSGTVNNQFGDTLNVSGQGAIGRVDGTVNQRWGDVVHGDKVGGDKVGGDKISVGSISGGTVAVGRNSHASSVNYGGGGSNAQVAAAFQRIYNKYTGDPLAVAIRSVVGNIENEAYKGSAASQSLLQTLLSSLDFAPSAQADVRQALREAGVLH
jgi:hypothetical protein